MAVECIHLRSVKHSTILQQCSLHNEIKVYLSKRFEKFRVPAQFTVLGQILYRSAGESTTLV
jgi:hypothetical protein